MSCWIRDNIIDNGAYMGRRSLDIVVPELPLRECARFWGAAANGNNPETGERPREKRYRLRDNYTRFYLKYVEPVKDIIDDGSFEFVSLDQFENVNAVMGLAFENLVINNYWELIGPLHLEGQLIVSAAPYSRKATLGKNGRNGVQIDFLIQTRRALCIVEIKRKASIGREIIQEVDARIKAIKRPDGVSARAALIYDGQLSPVLASDGYFDAIVPFSKLLGLA